MRKHESYRFTVTGRVQGVFFRQSAKQVADALGVFGWIRNKPDGSVEGCARGDDNKALRGFREWLDCGPERAIVQAVDWIAAPDSGDSPEISDEFKVLR